MNITKQTRKYIEDAMSLQINDCHAVSGGSINRAYGLQTSSGKFFIKINDGIRYPGLFEAESNGLKLIGQTRTVAVPEVLLTGSVNSEIFLLLNWIDPILPTKKTSTLLGNQLARMHQCSSRYFGLNKDNYMGSLTQSNNKHTTWSAFYAEERLQPMVKIAAEKQLIDAQDTTAFDLLCKNLPNLFDEEPSSLLHGDLWGGNYLISADNEPYLIDPAVSYGNREFDLAMTTLFGGFSTDFYEAYNETFPLQKGWRKRTDLWNLYPLLLHLNLFGVGYLQQVRQCLKKYV